MKNFLEIYKLDDTHTDKKGNKYIITRIHKTSIIMKKDSILYKLQISGTIKNLEDFKTRNNNVYNLNKRDNKIIYKYHGKNEEREIKIETFKPIIENMLNKIPAITDDYNLKCRREYLTELLQPY